MAAYSLRRIIGDRLWPGVHPIPTRTIASEDIRLGEAPHLFSPGSNGPMQQGDPVIRIYSNVHLWPRQSVAARDGIPIYQTFIDDDRIRSIMRYGVLREYSTVRIKGMVTSIDYVLTGTNVYHQFVDAIPRLWALRHPALASEKISLILPWNIKSEWRRVIDLVCPGIRVVQLPRWVRVRPDKYIHLPYLSKDRVGYDPCDSQTSAGFIPNEYLTFYRDLLLRWAEVSDARRSSRLIYISRSDAITRRVVNEGQVMAALEPMGFETVATGHMSLREQIRTFHEAKVIVTAHGAALTGLLYVRPESCAVVEMYPTRTGAQHYYSLHAKALDLPYQPLFGDADGINSDFHVSIDVLLKAGRQFVQEVQ